MNHAIITTVVCLVILFGLFVWICVTDVMAEAKKKKVATFKPVPATKPVKLELIYDSLITEKTMHIPVRSVLHAQQVVDILGLRHAHVGYRRTADGKTIELYKLDNERVLRRIKEVV